MSHSDENTGAAFEDRTPPPREEFRRELRSAFLKGGIGAIPYETESQDGGTLRTESTMDRSFEALLAKDPVPVARRRFQRGLREQFTSGVLAGGPKVLPRRPGMRPDRKAPPAPKPRGSIHPLLRPLLAVAALALVFFGFQQWRSSQDGLAWTVTHGAQLASLSIDGQPAGIAEGDLVGLAERLAGARSLSLGEGQLELERADGVHIALLPGAVLEGSPFGARVDDEGDDGGLVFRLTQGEIFLQTDPDSGKHDIRILTPHSDVFVVGTTLGVMCGERQTCVCVAEGYVSVLSGDRSAKPTVLGQGQTMLFEADRQGPVKETLDWGLGLENPGFLAHVDDLRTFHEHGTRQR